MLASEPDRALMQTNPVGSRLIALLKRFASLVSINRRQRRLHLCEMLSLGEKRFVAVVEYGPERFLLAGTPQSISLLKHLDSNSNAVHEAPSAEGQLE